MQLFVDLRYLFPPLVNLFFSVFRTSQFNIWIILEFDQYPFLKLTFLLIAILMLTLFLFTSITIELCFASTAYPIPFQFTFAARPITTKKRGKNMIKLLDPSKLSWTGRLQQTIAGCIDRSDRTLNSGELSALEAKGVDNCDIEIENLDCASQEVEVSALD
ncbi:hypothetical protein Patl1_15544 [Pistacia atlantica]|uniref:Uncharacterized protein n=1 Tax=Pistacia atlantica TaxID=434234 RepID=A0ACC1B6H7_9ROSI|nr:hypothetical protein Patl1_15544 [Pistacia atlantica]